MPSGHISGFLEEVLNLHVKYRVTIYKFVSNGRILSIKEDIKSESHNIHLTGYAISPISITVFSYLVQVLQPLWLALQS